MMKSSPPLTTALVVAGCLLLVVVIVLISVISASSSVPSAIRYYRKGPVRSFNTCGSRPMIALTFDDGPDPVKTPQVLRKLAAFQVHATFFVSPASQGDPTSSQCQLIETILAAGHSVQSHSWNHVDFATLKSSEVAQNLQQNDNWIRECSGAQKDKLGAPGNGMQFRPPFGTLHSGVEQANDISNLGYTIAGWNIDSKDTELDGSEAIMNRVTEQAANLESRSSLIVLMHDRLYNQNDDVLDKLIPWGLAAGYTFHDTVSCYTQCSSLSSVCEDEKTWPRWVTL